MDEEDNKPEDDKMGDESVVDESVDEESPPEEVKMGFSVDESAVSESITSSESGEFTPSLQATKAIRIIKRRAKFFMITSK
jgi:hypothetical protein